MGTSQLDLERAFETFEASQDFTAAIEEEFALLDPDSLDLVDRFEELHGAAQADPVLKESLVGELISSEVEIRSGRGESFADAVERQLDARARLFALAADLGIVLAATGTHPWAPWQEQRIIDTPHYRRVEQELQYVAWRNNTFSVHVHVGVGGGDRATAVADRLRGVLPDLLALSANSAYVDGRFAGLHSARSQVFTKSFPRCAVPEPFGSWREYADHVRFLMQTNSIVEATQLWWSIRPHLSFGTVEIRICDSQSRGDESLGLAALLYAAVAQAAVDYDDGFRPVPLAKRLIDENFWRAVRHGLDGKLIDLPRPAERSARAAIEALLEWTAPVRARFGLDPWLGPVIAALEGGNGAQRQWRLHEQGRSAREVLAAAVQETQASYVSEGVKT